MKFVVDEHLPPRLAEWLRSRGHDAVHVRELRLKSAPDRQIRDFAAADGALIITKDEDFVRIRRGSDGPILWLTCGNLRRSLFMRRFIRAWPDAHRRLRDGERLVETMLAS